MIKLFNKTISFNLKKILKIKFLALKVVTYDIKLRYNIQFI